MRSIIEGKRSRILHLITFCVNGEIECRTSYVRPILYWSRHDLFINVVQILVFSSTEDR
jgi:hypothetical protein